MMGYVTAFLRRPVLPTLILGLINASNWCWGMWRPGCTGHEVPVLMTLAIPFGAGVVSTEVAWFTALVMIIPPVMNVSPSDWRSDLFGCWVFYLAVLALVLIGRAFRRRVTTALRTRFEPSGLKPNTGTES